MNLQSEFSGAGDHEVSLAWLMGCAWRRIRLICACTILAGALGYAISYLETPVFRATVVVMAATEEDRGLMSGIVGQLGSLASVAGIDVQSHGRKEETLEFLTSRAFTAEFLRRQQSLPKLFPERWNAASGVWERGREPTSGEAFRRFDKKVRSMYQDRKTGAISISIELTDRQLSARWANALVAQLNEQLRERAVEDSRRSIGFLQSELARTQLVEVRQAISRLLESQFQTIMFANVRDQYALRIVDPAVVPDSMDRVRPQRGLFVVVAAFLGAVSAFLAVVLSEHSRTRTPAR